MSVGVFLGVRASYLDRGAAEAFLAAIEIALLSNQLPPYEEPTEAQATVRGPRFGRSELDHHGAAVLAALGRRGEDQQLKLVADNPFRVAYLPTSFRTPLETSHTELIGGCERRIWVGSARELQRELVALAPALEIEVEGDALSDRMAELINDGKSIDEDDVGQPWDDERSAWLLLFEGARLAVARGLALSLAG